jgi:hypothetical protein
MEWSGCSWLLLPRGLDAADASVSRPQLYVVAIYYLLGFPKRLLIVFASDSFGDTLNVIVARQDIQTILWHVDLLSSFNRPIDVGINIFGGWPPQDPPGEKFAGLCPGPNIPSDRIAERPPPVIERRLEQQWKTGRVQRRGERAMSPPAG